MWYFCFHWRYKKYHVILGYNAKYFVDFFTFDLFDLIILILGAHRYIVFT